MFIGHEFYIFKVNYKGGQIHKIFQKRFLFGPVFDINMEN